MKTFVCAAFVATFVAFMATSPAHSIPNENYKRTVQMLEGQDVTQFTLTPVPAISESVIYVGDRGATVAKLAPGENSEALRVKSELIKQLETEKKKSQIQTRILAAFQDRLKVLEENTKELERKVAGMQKQITILHAKKVNK